MSNSRSRLVMRLGDVNFPEYDGGLVYRTAYGHTMEWVEYYDDDENRGVVSSCDVPGPGKWRQEYWAKYLKSIANTVGQDVEELEADLDSSDVKKRASVLYYCVRGYTSLDDSPQDLSRKEIERRYARSGPRRHHRAG